MPMSVTATYAQVLFVSYQGLSIHLFGRIEVDKNRRYKDFQAHALKTFDARQSFTCLICGKLDQQMDEYEWKMRISNAKKKSSSKLKCDPNSIWFDIKFSLPIYNRTHSLLPDRNFLGHRFSWPPDIFAINFVGISALDLTASTVTL